MADGRAVWITGAGTGIGRAAAERLARGGYRVALSGRRKERLEETARAVEAAGGRAMVAPADVRDRAAVEAAADAIQGAWGDLWGLVNNAGISGPQNAWEGAEEPWRDVLATNLDGAYRCASAAVRRMAHGVGGRIVNVSSTLARLGVPGYGAYSASKAGLLGLTRALAAEWAPKRVTVNAIAPGWVETDMARQGLRQMATGMRLTVEEAKLRAINEIPLKRFLKPEEVADWIATLMAEEAGGITGQTFTLTGGDVMT